jgi:alpha-ketoglutarate-dependent taurine dioxygenase
MTELQVQPLNASFGALVTGIKLSELDEPGFQQLYRQWLEHALLVFPGQHLSNNEQVIFAKRFGDMEFELSAISNVKPDGTVRGDDKTDDVVNGLRGSMRWHCDSTFMPVQAKGAVFTAHVVPSAGGATGWADMRAGYDALDDATKTTISKLSAHHSLWYSQAKLGYQPTQTDDETGYGFHDLDPPLRPIVKTHPETGRKSLVIGRHAYGIPGMSEEASEQLLNELVDFACRPPRVYHHAWQAGDAVVWDNRCLLHQGTPWDMREPRVMYHSRIAGDPKTEFAEGHCPHST